MGKVIRSINISEGTNCIEFLKKMYSVNTDFLEEKNIEYGNKIYKNIELDSILVNIEENKTNIKISKLVSLKAFLLSKDQGMNINELIYNIDKVMRMSDKGLTKSKEFLVYDDGLEEFLHKANIEVVEVNSEHIVLNDRKRVAKVKYKSKNINFNTISECI